MLNGFIKSNHHLSYSNYRRYVSIRKVFKGGDRDEDNKKKPPN
ncbi:hypothetical protein LBO01_17950 [Companilactobacillus paralimentarius]|nr:hypothetical protein LBO01_17950 [Companilactobacillus paralimentarius]